MYKESGEWRGIKGFPAYEVSDVGMIRRITSRGHKPVKIRKKESGYLEVKLFKDGVRSYKLVHRLVCRAFNGEAPSEKHQVNHDDGDKENNLYTNLEWSTGKGNQNHARDTGLSNCSYKVLVHHLMDKTNTLFRSIDLAAEYFSVPRTIVEQYVRGYPNAIYNKIYKFELVYSEDDTTIRSDAKSVRVMDYVAGSEFLAGSPRLASYLTKVSEIAVRGNLQNGRLVNGYMFKSGDDLGPFPRYTVDAALMSREDFSNGVKVEHKLIVLEPHSGKSVEYDSVEKASLLLGIPKNAIYSRIRRKVDKPFKGYVFKRRANY